MPVAVECSAKPSKIRWLLMASSCAISLLFAFFMSLPFWAYLLPLLAMTWIAPILQSQPEPQYLRFHGAEMVLTEGEQTSLWQWRGQGGLSSLFVEFHLFNENDEKLTFRVWRDSLSNASWRALNMAFRVNQSHAQQLMELAD